MPCTIHVPIVTEQPDGTGVQTGHVRGVCSFAWHSLNQIEYRDRWHVLGQNWHRGGAAGALVSQPIDREDYGELYGEWREVVKVYDPTGTLRQVVTGPAHRIT